VPPVYELTVLAPDRQVFHGRVQSLVAPGVEGHFGVLASHAPMVAELTVGELKVADEHGGTQHFAVTGGFLEVTWEAVTVMADAAEAAADIDVARAHSAEERARERLVSGDSDIDHARARASLSRALNRLSVASRSN
jgi:F-type H+-transporting ATPase subunit epsilon